MFLLLNRWFFSLFNLNSVFLAVKLQNHLFTPYDWSYDETITIAVCYSLQSSREINKKRWNDFSRDKSNITDYSYCKRCNTFIITYATFMWNHISVDSLSGYQWTMQQSFEKLKKNWKSINHITRLAEELPLIHIFT